jgi:hypothetical protein
MPTHFITESCWFFLRLGFFQALPNVVLGFKAKSSITVFRPKLINRYPREMGRLEIEAFLTHLAVQQQVAAATQNQALNAIFIVIPRSLRT